MGRSTQITTTPRYTKREKKAFQLRRKRRNEGVRLELLGVQSRRHHFADNFGINVPTPRPRSEYL